MKVTVAETKEQAKSEIFCYRSCDEANIVKFVTRHIKLLYIKKKNSKLQT